MFGSNGNSYTICTQSDVCVYTYTEYTQKNGAVSKVNLKKLTQLVVTPTEHQL